MFGIIYDTYSCVKKDCVQRLRPLFLASFEDCNSSPDPPGWRLADLLGGNWHPPTADKKEPRFESGANPSLREETQAEMDSICDE